MFLTFVFLILVFFCRCVRSAISQRFELTFDTTRTIRTLLQHVKERVSFYFYNITGLPLCLVKLLISYEPVISLPKIQSVSYQKLEYDYSTRQDKFVIDHLQNLSLLVGLDDPLLNLIYESFTLHLTAC